MKVRFAPGLLEASAPLFEIAPPGALEDAIERIVAASVATLSGGSSSRGSMGVQPLLQAMRIDGLRSAVAPDRVRVAAFDSTTPGAGLQVSYTLASGRARVIGIAVGTPFGSGDVVDPVLRGFDAEGPDGPQYRFGLLRAGVPFQCNVKRQAWLWAPSLGINVSPGMRFPARLVVHVPDSLHWSEPGIDIVAEPDVEDGEDVIVGISEGLLIVVKRPARYTSPAEAVDAVRIGLPRTPAVDAADGREADFRLPSDPDT